METSHSNYRPEIDGIRALAVSAVIIFHAELNLLPSGFLGVDVFFVISGYLITQIIYKGLQSQTFSLRDFYTRRAFRILPTLYLMTIVSLPFAWKLLLPVEMIKFCESLTGLSLFASNVSFYKQSGYFESSASLKPLLHTWSLAVEEQFYFLFPLLCLTIFRLSKKVNALIFAALLIWSFFIADQSEWLDTNGRFYLLPARAWELIVGAVIAIPSQSIRLRASLERHSSWLASVGLLLILAPLTSSGNLYGLSLSHGVLILLPVLGTALVIYFGRSDQGPGRLLSIRPLTLLGRTSYSTYLWHQPLFAFYRIHRTHPLLSLEKWILVVSSFAIGYVSWRFVETKLRNNKKLISFGAAKVFLFFPVLFILISAVGIANNGFEFRLTPTEKLIYANTKFDTERIYNEAGCFLAPDKKIEEINANCTLSNPSNTSVVWGDSYAAALSVGMHKRVPQLAQYTASGCPPLLNFETPDRPNCAKNNQKVNADIARYQPRVIYLHANWIRYLNDVSPVEELIDQLRISAPKARIVLIGGLPRWLPSLPERMLRDAVPLDPNVRLNGFFPDNLRSIDKGLRALANSKGVEFLSAIDSICSETNCRVVTSTPNGPALMVWDSEHLTVAGAEWLSGQLFPTQSAPQ